MKYDLLEMGAKTRGNSVSFKISLPGIDKEAKVLVTGSFCDWELENSINLKYDSEKDLWKSNFRELDEGKYEYAIVLKTDQWTSNPSSDPYAKMTGKGGLSAFRVPGEKSARLDSFRQPEIESLIPYYLDLDTFNRNFEGVKNRVRYYLGQMGVNAIIFSPWIGYDHETGPEKVPLHFFAPDSSYGSPYDLKVMINECHRAGMAVIMDLDFSAVSPSFGIARLYPLMDTKPMLGRADESGKRIYLDMNDDMTRDFILSVCRFWIDEYNVDGFRFLNARETWDSGKGEGFRKLTEKLYELKKNGDMDEIFLFAHDVGRQGTEMLSSSWLNGSENPYFKKSVSLMAENRTLIPEFWKILDLNQMGFHEESRVGQDLIRNVVLNYTQDSWDHSLIVRMGAVSGETDRWGYPVGDRKNHWWKTKPYFIAQFTSPGIPVIFNGQEIGDNSYLPEKFTPGYGKNPVKWQFMDDFAGKDMYRFFQKLMLLRNKFACIRSRNFFHYFTDSSSQVIAYKRYMEDSAVVVAINFSNESHDVVLPFPSNGNWHEYLDDFDVKVQDGHATVKIPARYGAVFYQED